MSIPAESLSMTTDYRVDMGDPSPALRAIAAAGFSHVHWCHHWNTDFVYHPAEVRQVRAWLDRLGLKVLDIHASAGREKAWGAPDEYRREAGAGLVANRVEMAADLGAEVVILHASTRDPLQGQLRSLDALAPLCRRHGIILAFENLPKEGFTRIRDLFARFGPQAVGLCYDSGHGNLDSGSLDELCNLSSRLVSLHLHDNDGSADQHRLPFAGSVPWDRVAAEIGRSAYGKCVNLEVSVKAHPGLGEAAFLEQAKIAGRRLNEMIQAERSRGRSPTKPPES